jgi:hypothetical protein
MTQSLLLVILRRPLQGQLSIIYYFHHLVLEGYKNNKLLLFSLLRPGVVEMLELLRHREQLQALLLQTLVLNGVHGPEVPSVIDLNLIPTSLKE